MKTMSEEGETIRGGRSCWRIGGGEEVAMDTKDVIQSSLIGIRCISAECEVFGPFALILSSKEVRRERTSKGSS